MQQRRLAAIMFTDIVGYTTLMSKNEKEALLAIQKVRDVLKPLIETHNGKWQKEIGDGTLSSFSSAVDAVSCALDFQNAILKEDFKVRIGIHVGEVTMTDNDIFGDGVNIASRIEPLSPPGGIYITERVYEDISNKPEIKATLVGTRRLKNVERPIQIYTLVGDGLPAPPGKPIRNSIGSYINDLWNRRVPQILLIYLLLSFIVVQFIQWMTGKLMLSPNWFDLSWILLLTLLPSVGLMAYYHGRSGMDKWVKKEKIFVSANFIVSMVLILLLFHGKDLGATTQQVVVEDEEGNTVERIIPKNEFIKNIAVFNFENYTDASEYGWLSYGINIALVIDLEQDIFFQARGTESFIEELRRADVERLDLVRFNLKRNIAKDLRMDYILSGSYDVGDYGFEISMQLFETNNGKLVAEHTLRGPNVFDLVDQLTLLIKQDLQLPQDYIESAEDLPVSSILTNNLEAFRAFTLGAEQANFYNNYDAGIELIRNALNEDPDFVYASFNLALLLLVNNQMTEASEYMDEVMDKIYYLPERDQFLAKSFYYLLKQDHEKRIKVIEMWIDLYPEDIDARNLLAQIYFYEGEHQKAQNIVESALEIDDNRGNFYVLLADILKAQGKDEEALSYYQLYADTYPDHSRSFSLLGDYYFDIGNYEEAKKHYERSLLLSRNNVNSLGRLAMIKERQGAFEEALSDYRSALQNAETSSDSMNIFMSMIDYYLHRGQIKKVINTWEDYLIAARNEQPPLIISIFRVTRLYWYYMAHEYEEALQILEEEEDKFRDSFQHILSYGYMNYYIHQGEIKKAEAEMEKIRDYLKNYGSSGGVDKYYEGELSFLKGEYEKALTRYQEFKAVNTNFNEDLLNEKIVTTYIELGRSDEAKEVLNEMLRINPYLASAHYYLASILIDEGSEEEAREHLIIANEIWAEADKEYDLAGRARDLLSKLGNSQS